MPAVFQVLYTPHLKQKRKKWFDGQCKFIMNKVRLLDEDGRLLAEQFWASRPDGALPSTGECITFDRFLVELDALVRVIEPETPASSALVSGTIRESPKRVRRMPIGRPMGPSLETVLRDESVRVRAEPVASAGPRGSLNPANPIGRTDSIGSVDLGAGSPLKKQKCKYAPWGDPSSVGSGVPEEESLFVPDSFEFDSDLESEPEILDVTAAKRPLFADLPETLPTEGPWTKEAYLLFSWHPPVVKAEIP